MKRSLLTLITLSFVFHFNSKSQDFAPIGAEWHYNESFPFAQGVVGYMKFASIKDTIVGGELCREIDKYGKLVCNDRPYKEYVFTRNDTVFFYDSHFNEFQILYDFSALPADSWKIKIPGEVWAVDTVTTTVDSLSTVIINGDSLKVIHATMSQILHNNIPLNQPVIIYEKIGDIRYMFNWQAKGQWACDMNLSGGIRCYTDSIIGHYSTGLYDSCTYTFNPLNVAELEKNTIQIFPLPALDYFTIETDATDIHTAKLYSMGNKVVMSQSFQSSIRFETTHLKSGLYVVEIENNKSRSRIYKKILVQ